MGLILTTMPRSDRAVANQAAALFRAPAPANKEIEMLFCEKAKAKTDGATAEAPASDAVKRPNIAHSGKITLGGGCRLPLQGAPMEHDRSPRGNRNKPE
jgi:hypothetical protein